MNEPHPLQLALIDYYKPDPEIVSQLDKNGVTLAYVGHAEITKMLIAIDPCWTWEPAAWIDGRPATFQQAGLIKRRDGTATEVPTVSMWGRLTLLGVTRVAVGSVEAHKPDLDKELVSDFLRNAAMRFGLCLSLWAKPVTETQPTHRQVVSSRPSAGWQPTEKQQRFIRALGFTGEMPTTRDDFDRMVETLKAAKTGTAPDEHPF